ncbi:MAG TPA: CoA-transferase [Stellaceae bacterium]|nr:CoA-transferase [Stellaceae bacterium]
MTAITDLDEALRLVPDGAQVAIPPDYSGVPMEAARALIRRGARTLRLVTVPASSLCADLLIGAGVVSEIETSAVGFGELGLAPRFTAAVRAGRIRVKEATCPAIHAALRASEMGNPFAVLRGILGSDILAVRPDWRVIDNPFTPGDAIVALPALQPDVALFHAPLADRHGNVWVGRRRDCFTLAHASKTTVATVERVEDANFLLDEVRVAATIPSFYIGAVAEAPRGAWPMRLDGPDDTAHLREYLALAQSEDGFARYLERYVHGRRAA